jgi:NitT/TauT family transport system substrate-binding protein
MVMEGGGGVLADERALWPDGEFVTTQLIVRTEFLRQRPEVVKRLLEGHVRAVTEAAENPAEAKRAANAVIEERTGTALADEVMTRAWDNLTFTSDPLADSLRKTAENASRVGRSKRVDLAGIYDLSLLNQVLAVLGLETVSSDG